MKLWLGTIQPPEGFIKDTPVHALSVVDSADWLSLQMDVDDPLVDGLDCIRVLRNGSAAPKVALGIHEPDTTLRVRLLDAFDRYYADGSAFALMVSEDGGRTYTKRGVSDSDFVGK